MKKFFENYKSPKELKAEEIIKVLVCFGTAVLQGFAINNILKKD